MYLQDLAGLWDLFSAFFLVTKLQIAASDGAELHDAVKVYEPVSPLELGYFHQLKCWPYVCFYGLSHCSWLLDEDNIFLPLCK